MATLASLTEVAGSLRKAVSRFTLDVDLTDGDPETKQLAVQAGLRPNRIQDVDRPDPP